MTYQDRLCALVHSAPPVAADAIVVLCGEDAAPRLTFAARAFHEGAAPLLVVSGGKHAPPRWLGGDACAGALMGMGIAHDRILIEGSSQNTREQAVAIVAMAIEHQWRQMLLVGSPYHMPRVVLTFVQALRDAGQHDTIRIAPLGANQTLWHRPPAGMDRSRAELLEDELYKIDRYCAQGDVASYADGVAYLAQWEGR